MPSLTTLHIIGSKTMGGAERFCFRLVEGLNGAGVPSTLILRRGSEVAAQAAREGLPFREALMETVWDPISRASVARAIAREAPAVVQTYMGRATRLTRLPRGSLPVHISRLGGYYKLDGYRRAHAWVGNTQGICHHLVSHGFPRERVFHITNFIELPPTREGGGPQRPREELGLPAGAWIILSAGRFIPVKDHLLLLKALSLLPPRLQGREVVLVIIGEGPLRREYLRRAEELGVAERLLMPGWQEDPVPWFRAADLVVFPSQERETLGNVVLEAWALERPVVATRFRGAREIAQDHGDALLVECGDAPALARAVERALLDPDLRRRLAQAGRRKVETHFSREVVVSRYIELYRRLVEEVKG